LLDDGCLTDLRTAADLIITRHEPLIEAGWVQRGAHITAAGSGGPDKQELNVGVLGRACLIVAGRLG